MIYFGFHKKEKRVKVTDDKDCLSPDINFFDVFDQPRPKDIISRAKNLEKKGWKVCLDFSDLFYETK